MSPIGIRTWLPEDVKKQEFVTKLLIDLFVANKYEPISIPTLVDLDVVAKANQQLGSDFFKLVDRDGKTLALRSELTQPIAKAVVSRIKELEFPLKLYYNSTVFRYRGRATDDSRELQQIGVEYFSKAKDSDKSDAEILSLISDSMKDLQISDYQLNLTDARIWLAIFGKYGNPHLDYLSEIEFSRKSNLVDSDLSLAARLYKALYASDIVSARKIAAEAKGLDLLFEEGSLEALEKLLNLDLVNLKALLKSNSKFVFDPLQCPELSLYTGIYFNVICPEEGKPICAGGRYDRLCKEFGQALNAIGFAFYLPKLLSVLLRNDFKPSSKKPVLRIAVSKGTLLEGAVEYLKSQGLNFDLSSKQRKLITPASPKANLGKGFESVEILLVRGHDVPVYVDHGAADLGIVGSDAILDSSADLVQLKDLKYGQCKLCVCAAKGDYKSITDLPTRVRVATSFPHLTKQYFQKLGIEVELIDLYGSVELAPLVGLSDIIVDLVASGKTLAENNLEVIATIMDCTSTLVVNQASFKLYRNQFLDL